MTISEVYECSVCLASDVTEESGPFVPTTGEGDQSCVGHFFHQVCIDASVKYQMEELESSCPTCPLCRSRITLIGGLPLPLKYQPMKPIESAARKGDFVALRILLAAGEHLSDEGKRNALHHACWVSDLEMLGLLLGDPQLSSDTYEYGLKVAVVKKKWEVVKRFLAKEIPLSQETLDLCVPMACRGRAAKIVRALLSKGVVSQAVREQCMSIAVKNKDRAVILALNGQPEPSSCVLM